jgi:uncharacterized protein (TIGR03435 family)
MLIAKTLLVPPTPAREHRICTILSLVCGMSAIGVGPAWPQTTPAPPKFEVASVKPCKPGGIPGGSSSRSGNGGAGRIIWSPGRLVAECVTLDRLIREAYLQYGDGRAWPDTGYGPRSPISDKLLEQQIKGSPAWLDSDHYTIEAKAEGTPGREMMRGPMLQTLLEDRFKLKIHRETRETPVFELRVAKGGPKLQPSAGGCLTVDHDHAPPAPVSGQALPKLCGGWAGDTVYDTTMENLCRQISPSADRDVVDKTGIAGRFDVRFDLSRADLYPTESVGGGAGPTEVTRPTNAAYFAALENALPRLGLMLVSAREPGEFLVIDRVERPSEN